MSDNEFTQISEKIRSGLELAEWRMLKEKSDQDKQIVTMQGGKPARVSARKLYRKLYGDAKNFEEAMEALSRIRQNAE